MSVKNLKESFDNFFKIPNGFYKTIGFQAYDINQKKKSFLMNFIFYFGIINFNICLIGEISYFYYSLTSFSTFPDNSIESLTYLFAGFLADFKMISVWWNRKILKNLMNDLIEIFPNTLKLQNEFELNKYRREITRILIVVAVIFSILVWQYNIIPIIQSCIEYFILNKYEKFNKRLPYLIKYPFDIYDTKFYIIVYIHLIFAGYVCSTNILAADILLYTIITQICMHFDYLSMKLETLKINEKQHNHNYLKKYIKHHQKLFRYVYVFNYIFSI